MEATQAHHDKVAKLLFSSVYPHYVNKVIAKDRTIAELHQVIEWLTGFDEAMILQLIEEKASFVTFFEKAQLHPNAPLITGTICGYKIQDLDNELTRNVRYLDKLVDELAKGKKMEKILRTA